MDNIVEKIIDIFDILTGSGVRFYYGDDEVQLSQVTSIEEYKEGFIYIILDDNNRRAITVDDFRIYHSKENINLYDWEDIRSFDRLLEELTDSGEV